jgi:hypothetical protein
MLGQQQPSGLLPRSGSLVHPPRGNEPRVLSKATSLPVTSRRFDEGLNLKKIQL